MGFGVMGLREGSGWWSALDRSIDVAVFAEGFPSQGTPLPVGDAGWKEAEGLFLLLVVSAGIPFAGSFLFGFYPEQFSGYSCCSLKKCKVTFT